MHDLLAIQILKIPFTREILALYNTNMQ